MRSSGPAGSGRGRDQGTEPCKSNDSGLSQKYLRSNCEGPISNRFNHRRGPMNFQRTSRDIERVFLRKSVTTKLSRKISVTRNLTSKGAGGEERPKGGGRELVEMQRQTKLRRDYRKETRVLGSVRCKTKKFPSVQSDVVLVYVQVPLTWQLTLNGQFEQKKT